MSLQAPAIFLMGPTASGKTNLAVALYQHFLHAPMPIELISVDSALVYQGMDIGTAKPDAATLQAAPHHLIDIIPPTQAYSAANFRNDALALMADITQRGRIPLLVGGTMLYFKALQGGLSQLPEADAEVRAALDAEAAEVGWPAMHAKLAHIDPETAQRLMPTDAQRVQRALEVYRITGQTMTALHQASEGDTLPYNLLKLALIPHDRGVLHQRIAERLRMMWEQGFIDEVRALLRQYPDLHEDLPSMRCVGYRQVLSYLRGDDDIEALYEKALAATRQLAKRQLTWLRGMHDIESLDCLSETLFNDSLIKINQYIKKYN